MRQLVLSVLFAALSIGTLSSSANAEIDGRAVCEGYCATVAVGCYVLVGIFIGRDKCDAMYEGCVDGCLAALVEEET